MFTALIADDEPLARVRMRSLLEAYSGEIEILGEAGSGAQTIQKIHDLDPDVVFLDIQMPDMDAFEVLRSLNEDDIPLIVFTTAYDNFALRAFEENTVDYLLKPIDPERLAATMAKLRKRMPHEGGQGMPADFSWDKFKELMSAGGLYMQRLQVKQSDRILLVNMDEVIRFQSEEKYTTAYTTTAQYVIDQTLVELEKRLDPNQFVRVHRAHLVAIDYIAEIRKNEAGRLCIVLRDKNRTQITVSRNFVKTVKSL
ncbi:MAG: LytTR family transcriptional regulator DNA-binding domain-containing protein [Fibrobacter sp.]|nr:LytTR family transcriptional regulator DNA-binding domain-containing protein [Fibrobacter sp.]